MLTPETFVPWLDCSNADDVINERFRQKQITLAEAALCRAWATEGYVIARRLLAPEAIDEMWKDFEKHSVKDLLHHHSLLYYATLLLGTEVHPFLTAVTHAGGEIADASVLPTGPLLHAFVAFEDVNPKSGPMIYYPRSHRLDPKGTPPRPVVIRKGDVFFWHANLVFGVSIPEDLSLSRHAVICGFSGAHPS